MKLFRSIVLLCALAVSVLSAQDATKVAGAWKMALNTPHGPMPGTLQFKQEGAKLSGACVVEHMGSMALTGQLEGKKISFTVEIQPGQNITFMGTVDGDKMAGSTDPEGGEWKATRGESI